MRCSLSLPALASFLLQLCAATPFDRDSAVRSLAVLGSTGVERACLAVLVAPQFLAAPAHCVASFMRRSGQQLEFASFGFYLDAVPPVAQGDEWTTVSPPTRGAFNETERICITTTTLHPDFTFAVEPQSLMTNDWAVLKLEHAPLATNTTVATVGDTVGDTGAAGDAESTVDRHFLMEPLPFLDDSVSELYSWPSYFGALFVESVSLALTWVETPRLDNSVETCGLAQPVTSQPTLTPTTSPVSAAIKEPAEEVPPEEVLPEPVVPSDVVCATPLYEDSPPLPTANDSTILLGSLLLVEHYADPGYFVAGFGSSHPDLVNTQSFTWAEATGPEFLGKPLIPDTKWVHVQAYAPLIGYQVPVLEDNMKFMTGIRMTRKGENFCGASLIAPTFVLTAAHCLDDSNLDGGVLPWVSIGSLKTSGVEFGEQIRVIKATRHPQFDSVKLSNDLALLELKYPSVAAPVMLFNSHSLPVAGQIFGYGVTTSWGLVLSDVLRFVDVNVYASNQKCMLDLQMNIDDSVFCAGGQVGKDACDGDSGGPLVVVDAQGETALLGVISYGRGCGTEYLPGVYANVSQGLEFIKSIVPEAKWTSPVAIVKSPVDKDSSASHSGDDPVQTVNPGTPSSAAGSERGGGDGDTTTNDASRSGYPFVNTTDQSEYVLPETLAPTIREAVINFLIGENVQISSSLALVLLDSNNQIVFRSSESLAALEKIITTFNEKPLHQRKVRFSDSKGSGC
ncbi:Trypsin protease gip [Globisporangium polare]